MGILISRAYLAYFHSNCLQTIEVTIVKTQEKRNEV
jgi:hypothetical protein